MKKETLKQLVQRGVMVGDIAEIVKWLQEPYFPDLQLAECVEAVEAVLNKREVQHAVLTGIALDMLTEQKLVPQPLAGIIEEDQGLYGIDEVLAMGITNVYGTIGITSFGYLDKMKTGIIGRLHNGKEGRVNTFLDDLVAAIAAAAAAKIAHNS
ncbi:MAG: phosphatidylglycerophosphatase A [Bacillota bacterium]|uniref:Phosphatidylglycerophosphatase A n=1 Tax=Thermanaerosceptrum fracticalcis TaxID=1712410 RepID=A0A7G6E6G7_THEFR|nr:phosphatidylglycerophosphatase A [Thermanaerosceptrum fracticalcis]QNB47671.1 phosphatidylglycerophosphatase A [Thermanaerosceptrum fracticalcis]